MKIVADTNILIRTAVHDDASQEHTARKALAKADLVAVTTAALCEFVWVLSRGYRVPAADIAAAIRTLLNSNNVVSDNMTVEAGLANLDGGGDFADGVIAFQGVALGADTFVSFDKEAVKRLALGGLSTTLLR